MTIAKLQAKTNAARSNRINQSTTIVVTALSISKIDSPVHQLVSHSILTLLYQS